MFTHLFTHSFICTSIHLPSNCWMHHPSVHHPSKYIQTSICSSPHSFIHHPTIHLSFIQPSMYIYPFISLSIHSSIQPFIYHPSIYPSICPSVHSLFIQQSSTLQILVLSCPCLSVHSFPSALVLPYSRSPCLSSLESHPFPVSPPLLLPTALLLSNPAYRLLLATYARPPRGPGPPTPAWAKPTNTQGKPLCLWAPPGSPYLYRGREKSSYLAFPPLPAVASFALLSSQGGSSNALSSPLLCLFLLKAFPLSTGAESSLVLSSVFFLLFQPIYSAL